MRLFAALPLPERAIERLTSLRLRLSGPKDGLRWSEPEQWHITLQFFGDVADAVTVCLEERLRQMTAEAPRVILENLGLFAAKGILFAQVEPSESLDGLHRECVGKSKLCGMVAESRAFRPHITLARSKGKAGNKTLARLQSPALPPFGTPIAWTAQECVLLESTLRPQGAAYREVSRVALRSSEAAGKAS